MLPPSNSFRSSSSNSNMKYEVVVISSPARARPSGRVPSLKKNFVGHSFGCHVWRERVSLTIDMLNDRKERKKVDCQQTKKKRRLALPLTSSIYPSHLSDSYAPASISHPRTSGVPLSSSIHRSGASVPLFSSPSRLRRRLEKPEPRESSNSVKSQGESQKSGASEQKRGIYASTRRNTICSTYSRNDKHEVSSAVPPLNVSTAKIDGVGARTENEKMNSRESNEQSKKQRKMDKKRVCRWVRKKGTNKKYYISLDGQKLEGREAMCRWEYDNEALARRKEAHDDLKTKELDFSKQPSEEQSPTFSSGSHELAINGRPTLQSQLEFCWHIPRQLCEMYAAGGIHSLYPWQVQCLRMKDVATGSRNLIYSAPTSSGKTLVAEILMIRRILCSSKKSLVILPYVSMVLEQAAALQRRVVPLGICVRAFHGGSNGYASFDEDVDIGVCTIEKANSIFNTLMEERRLEELCCMVIDEVHMVGDIDRGYVLELVLSKARFLGKDLQVPIQIIGMSATIRNIEDVCKWLDAEHYITDYRPIPLYEMVKNGSKLYNRNMEEIRTIGDPSATEIREDFTSASIGSRAAPVAVPPPIVPGGSGLKFTAATSGAGTETAPDNAAPPASKRAAANDIGDPDGLVPLCQEVTRESRSVLIFCSTKKGCENCAKMIADRLPCLQTEEEFTQDEVLEARIRLVEELRQLPDGVCATLKQTIVKGVAYHHAGLTVQEREKIEAAFRRGKHPLFLVGRLHIPSSL